MAERRGLEATLRVTRGTFTLDARIAAPAHGVTAILGRSGSGKTTLLRCIAGLERARGTCRLDDAVWQDDARGLFEPAHRRRVGYVPQEPSLFPHLTVRRNLEFGLRRAPAGERRLGLDDVVDLLGIGALLDRPPAGLSGGERQRIATGRALLSNPRLLAMDEPLSALDTAGRRAILPDLERMRDALSIPVLYVTHATDEAASLAHRLVLLDAGRVVESGPAAELLVRPDLPPAREDDAVAVLSGRVAGHDDAYALSDVDVGGVQFTVPLVDRPIGAAVRLRVHARDVSIALAPPGGTSILNVVPARVGALAPLGPSQVLVRLECGDGAAGPLLARITRRSRDRLGLTEGLAVHAQVKSIAIDD